MIYDVVIIGAGLAGFSAALAAAKQGRQAIIVAKGMGNLYSASGYIDLLGYYPSTSSQPVSNSQEALERLITDNPHHPYSLIGKECINKSVAEFLKASTEMGLPYTGDLANNMLMPTAAGALVPTTIYPQSADKQVVNSEEIIVVGIKELIDFYPTYAAHNLEKQLGNRAKVKPVWVELGLDIKRELNSYDLALYLEKNDVRNRLISQLKQLAVKDKLVLIPAVLGVKRWQEVIADIEKSLECQVLEIPTLPPSVMGYRLAEAFQKYLQRLGVDFLIGYPVTYSNCAKGKCTEVGVTTANGRLKKLQGNSYVLASGGILGEGLQVYPQDIKEDIFNLPIVDSQKIGSNDFFDLQGQSLAYAGVAVNRSLQPIDKDKNVILNNVFVAGATLAGYDPFVEKSGNGVALASGYKAGLLAGTGGEKNEQSK